MARAKGIKVITVIGRAGMYENAMAALDQLMFKPAGKPPMEFLAGVVELRHYSKVTMTVTRDLVRVRCYKNNHVKVRVDIKKDLS